ncbi:MAG: toll/interleukin-1 receptor domain-containing protein, partial [Luteimonas sp.]|nr:toll/interleukin-1 receptor domain-containing protein [Luteimonas sp.]
MPKIFISYRREDSAGFAGRLADALEARHGADNVFRDVDDIRPGSDFVDTLHAALASCDVLVPLIGPRWLSASGPHGQRLHDPQDYVRREIAIALERGMTVIPALVEGARMPSASDLPAELADLTRRQALVLGDHSWSSDVQALMRAIDAVVPHDRPAGTSPPSSSVHPLAIARMPRRRLLWLGALAALGVSAIGVWHFTRLPQLEGDWHLDDGNR